MSDGIKMGDNPVLARLKHAKASTTAAAPAQSAEPVEHKVDTFDDIFGVKADANPTVQAPARPPVPETKVDIDEPDEDPTAGAVVAYTAPESLPFTLYDMSDSKVGNREYGPTTPRVEFVGDYNFLAKYITDIESKLHLTLSPSAYGVDISMFEGADAITIGDRQYELVYDRDIPYLSCCSQVLDAKYLEEILQQATCAIMEDGVYRFPLVGPRMFKDSDGVLKIIRTMRLNTYELNYLMAYLSKFENIQCLSRTSDDGAVALIFKK